MNPRRAAIYLRVSTEDQSYENQHPAVEQVVSTRGLDLVGSYTEQASAVKARPAFDRLMRDAEAGRFDAVVIWALDRLGRSMIGNLNTVLELDRLGVQVISIREPWLDTGSAVRPLLLAIFSWVAEQEREQLVARTKAGIARARAKGVHIGRPRVVVDTKKALALQAEGKTIRQISQHMRIQKATLLRAMRAAKGAA
jgi:putative DNA-invertase from lambdoid prophage Rac